VGAASIGWILGIKFSIKRFFSLPFFSSYFLFTLSPFAYLPFIIDSRFVFAFEARFLNSFAGRCFNKLGGVHG
jgi:hypothetical protein